ncbi:MULTISPECIES: hypothetical protein [unclassified Microcoleus]|uniref:hypothetical protein n=1 Tax=unclassified Microcoleus TaxID=2642155 RepID=UPI002FD3A9A3
MLYKGYSIRIWKSEWIGKRIDGLWYSLHGYSYREIDRWATKYKYVALVDETNPRLSREIWGGSTPLIALDLAKFSIDLNFTDCERWTFAEREERWKTHRLKLRSDKSSQNI